MRKLDLGDSGVHILRDLVERTPFRVCSNGDDFVLIEVIDFSGTMCQLDIRDLTEWNSLRTGGGAVRWINRDRQLFDVRGTGTRPPERDAPSHHESLPVGSTQFPAWYTSERGTRQRLCELSNR